MTEQHFLSLLEGFKQQKLSREELNLFLDAAAESQFESLLGDQLVKDIASYKSSVPGDPAVEEAAWESLNSKRGIYTLPPARSVPLLRRWWAAASIVLALGVGAYLWFGHKKNTSTPADVVQQVDIQPGKNGAVLTLADESQVLLDTIQNATIALQGGAVAKVVNGALIYESNGAEAVYNTMRTPRGRQFQLVLPDGTRVWLNAASSIRYPTTFTGEARNVDMEGEAYFEVVKNNKKPFRVTINGTTEIKVLGTHFNVNAYTNEESTKVALVEGSVQVRSGYAKGNEHVGETRSVVLAPGQQALVSGAGAKTSIKVQTAEIGKALAWKNGLFDFGGMRLHDVLRQLERWYDIDVVYEKDAPDISFYGKIDRNVSLNSLLDGLKESGIHFRIEGRKLIVLPAEK